MTRDFVLAQNKARRHITQAQLAMATTSVYAWAPRGNPQLHTECAIGKTSAQMAALAGVGERTIKQAKAVQLPDRAAIHASVGIGRFPSGHHVTIIT